MSDEHPSSPRIALRAEGLHAALGRSEVLRGVDLEVPVGRVVGVLGPSGAGKTTFFRAMVGELAVDSGRVLLDDVEVTGWPLWRRARRGLGYVPQTPSVLFDLSVRKNIETFSRVTSADQSVDTLAARFDLGAKLEVRAADLSGGERRRLEVLRALVANPAVLVCDEPFAGVDPVSSHKIGQLLRDHAKGGASVVLADHRVSDALQICDLTHLLVEGRVELSVSAAEFAEHPAVRERYLG